jgi:CRISPR system Cascade subunit CasD
MSALVFPLAGPLQSWVTGPHTNWRVSQRLPSRSGVLGLLAAALGLPRGELDRLPTLRLAVRVDRPGRLLMDYQTVQAPYHTNAKEKDLVTRRWLLADAAFTVAAEGEPALLEQLHAALRSPVFPVYLGRNCCPPAVPLWQPDGLRGEQSLDEALAPGPVVPLEASV